MVIHGEVQGVMLSTSPAGAGLYASLQSGWIIPAMLVLIAIGQQIWIFVNARNPAKREELFKIITENAADMIALVNVKGRRLYNSPAYHKVLGYTAAELARTPVFEQIHPDDRARVLEASRLARQTGVGQSLQYRIRHKNGSWRVLESTASTIRNSKGEVDKLVIVNRGCDRPQRNRTEAGSRCLARRTHWTSQSTCISGTASARILASQA